MVSQLSQAISFGGEGLLKFKGGWWYSEKESLHILHLLSGDVVVLFFFLIIIIFIKLSII